MASRLARRRRKKRWRRRRKGKRKKRDGERGSHPLLAAAKGRIQQQNSDVQVVYRARARESFPSFGDSLIFTPDSFFLKFSDAVGGKREVGRRKEIFKEEEEGREGKKIEPPPPRLPGR